MKKLILFLFSALSLILVTACSDDSDLDFNYEIADCVQVQLSADISGANCISSGQALQGELTQVKGLIILKKIKSGTTVLDIIVVKGIDGKEYSSCSTEFNKNNVGKMIIFSGLTYGPSASAFYYYIPSGGFLKVTELWLKK